MENQILTMVIGVHTEGRLIELPKELLPGIFANLSRKVVLTLRGTNSFWIRVGSEFLKEFEYRVVFDRNRDEERKKLKKLNQLLQNGARLGTLKYFPLNTFRFYFENLEADVVQTFFDIYGQYIRKLGLFGCRSRCCPRTRQLKSLRRLLIKQIPNLEHLALVGLGLVTRGEKFVRLFPRGYDKTSPEFTMKKLKTLGAFSCYVDEGGTAINEIFDSAPMLNTAIKHNDDD